MTGDTALRCFVYVLVASFALWALLVSAHLVGAAGRFLCRRRLRRPWVPLP